MKKGQVYEGIVEKIDFPNKGIIRIEEEKVIVKNTIPGQTVKFQINKKRKGKCEGRLLEVLEHSKLENTSDACKYSGLCGGCIYQTLPLNEQLYIKEKQVRELLDTVKHDYEFEGIKKSPVFEGYRNKMEFSFGDELKDGPLSLGLHKRNSFYDIVTVDGCRIASKDYSIILRATLDYFKDKDVTFYKKMQHVGYLRHLVVRNGIKTGEILINIVTTTQQSFDMSEYKDILLSLELNANIVGIIHTKNDSLADVVKSDEADILYGRDYFYEELLGLKFKISPYSFFQTNSLGAEILYETVREYAGLNERGNSSTVFDLYSGTGTIAQLISPVVDKVVGIEIVEEAVEAAKENAKLNGLENCSFVAGDVLKEIDNVKDKPDMIILDPPRDGVNPKALQKIIQFGVEHIVYISCKPTSLARDLEILEEAGYRLEKACCVDMFAMTANVETIALLSLIK